ncbi:MAG: hypothetical protein JWN70_231 [Planctomycetaceae bacterium]|nr:hypothetical protein [Planctomycetaceae bacterium]
MIDLFVRWLAKQRHEKSWRNGRRRRQSIKLKQQVEPLELRLVLSEDDFPIRSNSGSGLAHSVTIYSDLTGDGLTPDDVPVPFTIQVFKQLFFHAGDSTPIYGPIDGEDEETGVYGTFEMPNGGLLGASHTIVYWQDRNLNGLLDPWDGDPAIRPEILYTKSTSEFAGLGAGGEPTANFPADQTWVLSDSQYDADGNQRVAYVRQYTVHGTVYEDLNANGARDAGEPGIQTAVFSDWNRNGIWDEPDRSFVEPNTNKVVDANGFTNLDGTFDAKIFGTGKIGVGYPDGLSLTTIQGLGLYSAPGFDQPDSDLGNMVFGVFRQGQVQGRVFSDPDGDGVWHPARGEEALPGITVTVKQNGKTYTTVSGLDGYFAVYVGPGAYQVSQDLSGLGVTQTVPTDPNGYTGTFTASGQVSQLYQFGRVQGQDVAISAATRKDAKGVDFTWQSTSDVGSFEVQLFQSTDLVWDHNDLPLETPLTIRPSAAGGTGLGRVTFTADYTHNSIRPYLIAVADPGKKIGETNEQNNAFVVQRIIDLSPLQVTGDFTYDAPNDQFVSNGAAQVGFKPLIPDVFVPLVGGNITYNQDQIKISGTVTTNYGDLEIDLFEGNVTINVHSGNVSNLNVVTASWQLVGCQFAFDQFNLVNPGGGSAFDSYLNVQGSLVAPDTIGLFKVQFAEPNFIHFGPQTHGISATIPLGDTSISLDRVLTLLASGASISFLSKTEANPDGAFRIQGKFVVQNEALESPDDPKPTLDISGPNFIEFGANGVFFVGQFSIKNFTVIRGFLQLKTGSLFLDSIHHEWKADGELVMKPLMDQTVILGAGFVEGDFNYIKVGLGNLNYPTFMAGIFLDKVALAVDGLAGKKKNAQQEIVPIEVSATLGLTEGPKIQIPAMPLIGVDGGPAAIAKLTITGLASTQRVNGSVLFTFMDPLVVTLTGSFDWNWKKDEAKLTGGINALAGSITGTAGVTVNQRGTTGSATLTGALRIPKGNGLFYGSIAEATFRGYFQYLNAGNSYVALAADVTLPILGRKSITAKVTIANGVEYFFGDMVSLENLPAQPQSASFFATAFAAPQAQEAAAGSDTFTVPSGAQQLLVSATWANELEDAKLELVRPDGTIMTESELDDVNAALIPEMTSSTSRAIALLNPMEGEWQIRVVSAGDPGETQYAALRDGPKPTIEVLDAQVASDGVTIQYTATDSYPDATVALFYDTDKTGFDGLSMIENLPVSGEPTTYHWDLSHSFSGTYYIYAVITDAQGNVQFQYLDTPVTVDADPPTSSVTVLSDVTHTSSFTLSWSGADDTNGSGLASYDIFVSDNGGDYTLFLGNTTQTTTQFDGELGHTYAFYSVATDAVGRTEETPATADAQTVTAAPGNQSPDVLDALFSLAENSALNTPVGGVSATDPDVDDTLTYSITGGNTAGAFAINASTGAVTVANPAALDFETIPTFTLTVQVADNHGATDTATVQVNLTDVNDPLQLNLGGADVTWIKKQPAVVVLPQVTVAGASLPGGILTISLNAPGKKKAFDVLSLPSSSGLGTTGGLQFANGHLTLQIQLGQSATSASVQAFLRGIKFSTKGAGLKALTRTLTVSLTNDSEQSSAISQTIHVKKKP